MNVPRALVALCTSGALLFIALACLGSVVYSGVLLTASPLELLVFVVQFAKLGTLMAFKDLRNSGPSVGVNLFGAEALLLPVLALAFTETGAAEIQSIITQVFGSWVVGAALAGLIYGAYRLGDSMYKGGKMVGILPGALGGAELGVLFASAAASPAAPLKGLTAVTTSAVRQITAGASPGPGVAEAFGVIYVGLVVYSSTGWNEGPDSVRGLVYAVAATFAVAGVVASTLVLAVPPLYLLLPPAIAMLAVTWWVGRAA